MVFKTWLTGLNDVQKAINNISTLSTTANGATHLFSNSAVVQQYASALNGLNKEQVLLALSYKNLSTQQKEQILAQMGLIASENTIQSELLQTTLAQKGVSAEKSKAILIELGLMNQQTGELLTQKACTKADLEAILAQKGITGAQAEGIISALGLSSANAGLTASFGLLTKAIWGTVSALLANPMTWVVAGLAGVVTVAYQCSQAIEEVEAKAQELNETFSTSKAEIEDYKTQIDDLYKVINDSGSSIEDVTTARQNLMTIQDQLIEKFGDEKDTIDLITDAINGQTSALNTLTEAQWQAAKNEFNESGFWNDVANGIDGYSSNIDRMLGEYEGYSVSIDMSEYGGTLFTEGREEFEKMLQDEFGAIQQGSSQTFTLSGDVSEVREKLLDIQEILKENSTYKPDDTFSDYLGGLERSADDVIEKYEDFYKQYVLYEEIFTNDTFTDSYKKINDAYSEYKDAFATGDEESIKKAQDNFANILTQATEGVSDESVVDFFNDMYPDLQEVVGNWQFETNFTANTDGLKDDVSGHLSGLDGLYSYDLKNFSYDTATEEQKASYDGLISVARLYGLTIDQLIDKLVLMGLVQDEEYQRLVDQFGKENIAKIAPEDLTYAYQIKNIGELSFEELQAEIQRLKDEASNPDERTVSFVSTLNSADYAETKEKLLDLAKSGELTPETLSSTEEYNAILKDLQITAEDATNQILDMLSAQEKLSGLSQGLDKLKTAYEEFKDEDIGFVTAETLESLPDAFKNLPEFDLFSQIVGDPTSGAQAIQQAFNDICRAYLLSQDTLQGLVGASDHEIQSYIANLKQMGISNSEELVNQTIAVLNEENELINAAEEEYYNAYLKYLESKDKADLEFLENSASNNGQLVSTLGSAYKSDYDNWCNLLTQKAIAYNRFVSAMKKSQDATLSSAIMTDEAKAKKVVSNYEKFGAKSGSGSLTSTKLTQGLNGLGNQNNNSNSLMSSLAKYSKTEYDRAKKYLDSIEQAEQMKNALKLDYSPIKTNFSTSYSPSTSSSSKSDSSKDSTEKSFDWIENKISDVEGALDDLDSKVSNTYSSWTERNKSLADSIAKTKEAISLQRQAYTAYMNEANAVGLSGAYKKLVQKGALDIETITDSDLADRISEYESLYSKAQDCLKAENELKQTLNELSTSDKWDLIKTEIDADIDVFDKNIDAFQAKLDKLELQGMFANTSYYESMMSLTQKKMTSLVSEANQLQSILATMTQGTEAYDTLFSELLDIRQQISELENDCIEFNNNIRDLNWEVFEYLEDSISRITNETEYLIELLSKEDLFNDNGNLTKYADATIGLHATAYDTYKQQAQDYYEEVQELQKQLVDGAGQDVLEQYYSMVEKHQEAILAAENEKQAILDLIKEGYEAQLDALNEIINKKKEALNAEKELSDYQKTVEDKAKTVSSLEKQKLAYEGDDSEEARSKIQQITVDLEEARADLEQTEYEKYLADQESMLDSLSSEYEQWINERMDNSDALLDQIVGEIATEGDEINATLNEVSEKYGTMVSDSITSIFDSNSPFTNGLTDISNGIAGTTLAINNLIAKVEGIAGILGTTNAGTSSGKGSTGSSSTPTTSKNKNNSTGNTSSSNKSSSAQSSANSANANTDNIFIYRKDGYPKDKLKINTSIVDRCKYNDFASDFSSRAIYYSKLGGSGTYRGSASQNRWLISKMKEMGYKSGTSSATKGLHWTQENGDEIIIRKSDGAMLTPLNSGDMVLNNEASKKLWEFSQDPEGYMAKLGIKDIMPNFNIKVPDYSNLPIKNNTMQSVNNDIQMNITLPNVKNYDEFKGSLIKDRQFEEAVQSMTLGNALGHNSLNKYRH